MSAQAQAVDDEEDADDAFQTPQYWDDFYDDEEVYDWYSAAGAMYAAARRELTRIKGRKGRVLDVGCGTASHLAALAKHADVMGVDFSETVIAANKAREEGVTYVCEDVSSLASFEDGSFDVILDKGCLDCFVSAPDASFARREAFLRSVTRVLAKDGVYVCMPVCGVDVVTLLNYGVACRAAPGVSGVAPLAGDDWEARRSGNGACTFEVLQIVASQQKHLFRCAPNAGGDVALLGALLDAGSLDSSPTLPATGDDEVGAVDADDDADFDDAPCASLTLRRGFFCGSCGGTVAPLKFPLEVPKACPNCRADVRRFAMS